MKLIGKIYVADLTGMGKEHYAHIIGNHWRNVKIAPKDINKRAAKMLDVLLENIEKEEKVNEKI